ncbi:hypothetical protein AZH53_05015 [Methanomicrobiaceae archaeon CYW5]|uniref:hypothetical protein n=1 Tax=Methanovulcanius yangii TaxID=1789227 RepID=UPI0029CA6B6E|nr:hypothetical protein [Methanovulcanius yangii]MBT8507777.1 hypothetical protein [Methanovulcanius yangii]
MSRTIAVYGIFIAILAISLCAGCLTYSIHDATYGGDGITVRVSYNGETTDKAMQVTIYDLSGFRQVQVDKIVQPVTLEPGENTVVFPVELEPGNYRLHIYITKDGERISSVIRDIEV